MYNGFINSLDPNDRDHFFQVLLQSRVEAVYGVDLAGKCLFANQTCLDLLHIRDREELIGKDVYPLLHVSPEAPAEDVSLCDICLAHAAGKRLDGRETILWRKDSSPLHVRLSSFPFNVDGKAAGFITTFVDISEQARIEEQNSIIINTSPDSFWIVDRDGYFLRTNEATSELLGYSNEEIIGMHIADIDVFDKQEDVRQRIRAIEEQGSCKFTSKQRKKDGTVIDVEVAASSFLTPEGDRRIFAFIRDVTDRLAAERELRGYRDKLEQLVERRTRSLVESEERYKNMTEKISDWIWEGDVDGKFIYSNPRVEDILGYTPEEVIGKAPGDFMPFEEDTRIKAIFDDAGQQRKSISNIETRAFHKNGRLVTLEISAIPLYSSSGSLRGYRGINRDITEKKEMENAIRAILASTSKVVGQDFFDNLADTLCSWLKCEIAFISQIEGMNAKALVLKANGVKREFFKYTLAKTPCEIAVQKGFFYLPNRVPERFPESKNLYTLNVSGYVGIALHDSDGRVMGIIAAMSENILELPDEAEMVLKIMADRAAVEIGRLKNEQEIKEYARMQTILLREINHRVKNNLFAILSMINSEKKQFSGKELTVLLGLETRVIALAAVHDLLSRNEWQPINLSELCKIILERIDLTLKSGQYFKFSVTPSGLNLHSKQAHYVAMLIGELAFNSIKYGQDNEQKVCVTIHIEEVDKNIVKLIFRDDGPGFPADVLNGHPESGGIGLEIVDATVTKGLDGDIKLKNDGGAIVTIYFLVEDGVL